MYQVRFRYDICVRMVVHQGLSLHQHYETGAVPVGRYTHRGTKEISKRAYLCTLGTGVQKIPARERTCVH